jgi:hypothetical protein
MEQPWGPEEDVPRLPRRDEPIPPPWFDRPGEPAADEQVDPSTDLRFSWARTLGLFALIVLIVWVPVEFAMNYFATDQMGRTTFALGFVWAVVIEGLAVWGLIRLLKRR